jgi:flagellar biosynthetic protein FliP
MRIIVVIGFLLASVRYGFAQDANLADLLPEDDGTFSGRIIQGLVLLTVLSIAPGLLITTTCFTRFIIAFSFLRSGLGLQSTPSNLIVISLSLFMTYFVMAPVFEQSWKNGVQPLLNNQITQEDAFDRTVAPLKAFMIQHIREKDINLFEQFIEKTDVSNSDFGISDEIELRLIVPAFLLSEIRRGFEIGFLILLPFLVIDLVVSTVTMAMGMMMLPPTVVSLPFKVLFFVLIDGWYLIVGELLKSVT